MLRTVGLRRALDKKAKRRARDLGATEVENISRDEIMQRDNQTCHLCLRWVSVHDASLDHVVPLSKGGQHTKDNVRLAHRVCNSRKGDRLLSELDLSEF